MRNFSMHLWRTLVSHEERIALVNPQSGEETSFKTWARRIHRAAIGWMEMGLDPGERVALVCASDGGEDLATLVISAWLAGAVLVPLVPTHGRPTLMRALARSGTTWIVGSDSHILAHIRGGDPSRLPSHLRWVSLDERRAEGVIGFDTIEEKGRYREARGGAKEIAKRMFEQPLERPSLVLFDHQEREDPHGAFFDSPRVARLCEDLCTDLLSEETDRLALALPLGSFFSFLSAVGAWMGGRAVSWMSAKDLEEGACARVGATHVLAPTEFLDAQARRWRAEIERAPEFLKWATGSHDASSSTGFSLARAIGSLSQGAAERVLYEPIRRQLGESCRIVYIIGQQIPEHVVEVLQSASISLCSMYGWPEIGVTHLERPGALRPATVGRPILGVTSRLMGQKASSDTPSEILVRSDGLMLGYWDEEGPRSIIDGWLHTAQMGRMASGYLTLVEETDERTDSGS